MGKTKIRWGVFLIPWLLIMTAVIISMVNGDAFNNIIMSVTDFILGHFDWLFAFVSFFCVVLIIAAYFSPFGNVRIGGKDAKPILGKTNYIWIVLCTIMAAGILLWACAEPMYHYYEPPASIASRSPQAITFIMKNAFLEWTFTPMCIYGVPAILFAFLIYNCNKKYSIGSMLFPAMKENSITKVSSFIDGICLFSLVCGMAASMGSAIFLLSDGISSLSGGRIVSNPSFWLLIATVIVAAFVSSAVSGVMKGIRILSTFNSRIYIALGIFVFIFGPTSYILRLTFEGIGAYLSDFCQMSLFISAADDDKWAMWWPVFYWCNWMAWMPVTATFLGKISRGYTVKEAIRVIIVFPALFSIGWLGLFTASSLFYELSGFGIRDTMLANGTAAATYAVLQQLPLPVISIGVFLMIVFVSFITASDSNTNAMSGLCTENNDDSEKESPAWLKIVWGITIGVLCMIFLYAFRSTDALKYLSNLGGFPVLFLLIIICISFIKVMISPDKYDIHKSDYEEKDASPTSRVSEDKILT